MSLFPLMIYYNVFKSKKSVLGINVWEEFKMAHKWKEREHYLESSLALRVRVLLLRTSLER